MRANHSPRAARRRGLVAGLVTEYVDPDSKRGLSALGAISQPKRMPSGNTNGPTMGWHSFEPYDSGPPDARELPEVLNAVQAAQLLQLDEQLVLELAEQGRLPGRKLGPAWRFSRAALIAWLGGTEAR